MSNIFKSVREGFYYLIRNKWMTLISLISVMVTLFIVGVFTVVLLNVNEMTEKVEQDVSVVVFADPLAGEEEISTLESSIRGVEGVKSVDHVTKEEGLDDLIEVLGEKGKAFDRLKDDNPLSDSFIVKATDPLLTEGLSEKLKGLEYVNDINYGKSVIDPLFSFTGFIRNVGLFLISGLVLTALLLIANTIKMTIEMRKDEIKIMRLVGATNMFIRVPFVIEGALIGLIGAVLPIISILLSYEYLNDNFISNYNIRIIELIPVGDIMLPVIGLLLAISVTIGMLGSAISIGRYLKI